MPRWTKSTALLISVLMVGVCAAESEQPGIKRVPAILMQVAVSDLDRSISFYTEMLGFELESVNRDIEWARLKTGIDGVTIGLGRQDLVEGSGTLSMNFGVPDVDVARTQLEEMGVEFVGPTIDIPGVVRLVTLLDPDGNRIRLASHANKDTTTGASASSFTNDKRVANLGWISGAWRGELFGSHAEERWSAPGGHHMLGVFHLWTDDGPGVYELLEISESKNDAGELQVFLRFKHFNVGTMEPWEKDEPLEFILAELDGQRALFSATSEEQRVVTSMEYRRDDDDMRIHVKGEHDGGEAFEFVAEFQLASGARP